ncbi:MAG: glycosyltransferase family 2 protein [Patescibacteria group bacterium]
MLIAIILPIHNAQTTIVKTLKSLVCQSLKFNELIIVNDASSDNSVEIIHNFLHTNHIPFVFIHHDRSLGLARSYNDGIQQAESSLIVTFHQDVILKEEALRQLVSPFLSNSNHKIVASYHNVLHPYTEWRKYNFWGKMLFAKLVGKKFSGLDGKFDCYDKQALIKVGLFDSDHYMRSGEDSDIVWKLKKIGRVVPSNATILHLHNLDPNFGIKNVIYKYAQQAETQGVLLRNQRITNTMQFIKSFHRELLVVSFFLPPIRLISIIAIGFYSVYYTWPLFFEKKFDLRIFLLPFINISLLFISMVYSIKGFISNKQEL